MNHLSQYAAVAGILVANLTPTTGLATETTMRPSSAQYAQTNPVQRRWLAQYGPSLRVEPLCNSALISKTQVLSLSSCAALSGFQDRKVHVDARTVRIVELKRDRAVWRAISRRDQRILEQYEVVVVGGASAVAATTGSPR